MKEIWLIRHGQTEWSATGQHTGRTDKLLTETGMSQARRLQPCLAGVTFAKGLTSPLQRARRTAELAGLPAAEECADLLEWDYGSLEGKTSAEIATEFPGWSVWDGPIPRGESIDQVASRAQAALARCGEGRVALVAHGHILRVLTACWLGLPPQDGRLFALATGSLSVLGLEHETHVITSWNRVP